MPDVSDVREAIRPATISRRPVADRQRVGGIPLPARPATAPAATSGRTVVGFPRTSGSVCGSPPQSLPGDFFLLVTPRYSSILLDTSWCQLVPIVAQGNRSSADGSIPELSTLRGSQVKRDIASVSPPLIRGLRPSARPWGLGAGQMWADRSSLISTFGDSEDEGLERCRPCPIIRPTCGQASSPPPFASRPGPCAGGERVAWDPLSFRRGASSDTAGTTSIPGPVLGTSDTADRTSSKMHMRRLAPARACHRMCCNQARHRGRRSLSHVRHTTITGGSVLPTLAAGSPPGNEPCRSGFCWPQVSRGPVIA